MPFGCIIEGPALTVVSGFSRTVRGRRTNFRRRRLAFIWLAVYAIFLAATPFEHHDLLCELKTPLHCTACASSVVGSDPARSAIVGSWTLTDLGSPPLSSSRPTAFSFRFALQDVRPPHSPNQSDLTRRHDASPGRDPIVHGAVHVDSRMRPHNARPRGGMRCDHGGLSASQSEWLDSSAVPARGRPPRKPMRRRSSSRSSSCGAILMR